ncbi:alpha carbonic anhydrase [Ilyonectria destructans]|nr:alpha carbonic anhydrase [Ilyonectria destructans]
MVQFTSTAASLLALAGAAVAACNYGTSFFPREANVPVGTFGYTGLNGPLNWYGLNKTANKLCAKGRNQSPINLNASIPVSPGKVAAFKVDNYPHGSKFENLGTTVEVPANGTLTAGGRTYSLAQFHFHTPSEHRFELEYFPMEAHFVFQAKDKSIAVVAFPIALGLADPLLASVFAYVSGAATPGQATLTGPLIFTGLEHHLTSNPIYHYSGSLTTPPCSESVEWIISTKPLHIDEFTYNKVKSVVNFNSRYTQNTLGGINLLQNIASELA